MACSGWSSLPGNSPTEEIMKYTEQIKSAAEQACGQNFNQFVATLYRQQLVAGMNYVVKVDIGVKGKCVHVQYFWSLPCYGGKVEFKHAGIFNESDPLNRFKN